MSKLLEFVLGSILIAVFTIAFIFFSALQYIFKAGSFAHCTWQGSVKAWIDSNGDGQVDVNEPPLDGVEIYVEQVQAQLLEIRLPVFTDQRGNVEFNVAVPGCSDTLFEIYVDIPYGYRVTTRPRIEINAELGTSTGAQPVYYFGFIPDR